jgi:hypothetical protein
MGLGRSFVLAAISLAVTVITLGYAPALAKDFLSNGSGGGLVVQLPNYDTTLLLELSIIAGALAFAQKMAEGSNMRLSGFFGVIKYLVIIYYTYVSFQMIGTVLIPSIGLTIRVAFLLLMTLVIVGIALNMLALIVKISAPREFEKKAKTAK